MNAESEPITEPEPHIDGRIVQAGSEPSTDGTSGDSFLPRAHVVIEVESTDLHAFPRNLIYQRARITLVQEGK